MNHGATGMTRDAIINGRYHGKEDISGIPFGEVLDIGAGETAMKVFLHWNTVVHQVVLCHFSKSVMDMVFTHPAKMRKDMVVDAVLR